ncbi:Formate/glycerate dehydrogenase catalytic domain-like protein [Basidiobolus meristosporus CBS 931.73]|uniref:Saccharopine dehydrogenase [NAD(+), L-lysine-forming] n=1 Tax=Basidiobolus meristosporus CBS 931.73 TaxID=1314790 RepID=A0A1Y1Y6N2_9FUNG|nr:Formate/glycerate dehydrogenase catalytic domain-like protein [Basidiobolus meristosporus CBS 931.73]|eukprot:ORX93653.1 Formate/glycerate dehydrogenase catalytic domain-like protein [Basidiobolus meristosporus CBS 931.73]
MEHRAALSPSACKTLLEKGFQVTVEKCEQRIFDDKEYADAGCTIVPGGAWKNAPKDAYIIGLKELPEETTPLEHTHIFFAHCFKNQGGWKDILGRFVAGNGTILDLEFLNDENGRRVAAFGFHAGFAGTAIGLDVWCQQLLHPNEPLAHVKPYPNEDSLIAYTKERLAAASAKNNGQLPKVLVIGALGRCGKGAVDYARKAGIPEENIIKWDMQETAKGGPFKEIIDSDVFVNCIYLSHKIPPFVSQEYLDNERKLSVIVDVSCDTTNPNNPIPVYSINTTFDKPTVPVKTSNPKPLDVVSIDHLPTLLPREASEAFCHDLLPSILSLPERQNARVWTDAEKLFKEKVASMDQA